MGLGPLSTDECFAPVPKESDPALEMSAEVAQRVQWLKRLNTGSVPIMGDPRPD